MKQKTYKVSAIVPAYNEQKKIRGVLTALAKSPDVEEIICVNDGSTDETMSIAKSIKGVKLISFDKNYGKAYAIAQGVLKAKGNIVIFVDADLVGLNNESISALINPLKTKRYDAVVGFRSGKLDKYVLKPLSGERAYFKKDLLPLVEKIKYKGYGLELYLNYAFKNKEVKLLALKGVYAYAKHTKQPLDQAIKFSIVEIVDLLLEIFRQKNPINYFIKAYLQSYYIKK